MEIKNNKTYEGFTLKELKELYNPNKVLYKKYRGYGDFGVEFTLEDGKKFFRDDFPLMDRRNKAEKNSYTGTISNLNYSCELFIDGVSIGTTSKHRARVFLRQFKKGIEIESTYLSSKRNIKAFLEPSEKDLLKTNINKLVHQICPDLTKEGHKVRNKIRQFAYQNGIEATKEKYF